MALVQKVVFILQQADLARPEELSINTEKVKKYAIQRGISAPLVFATSAIFMLILIRLVTQERMPISSI